MSNDFIEFLPREKDYLLTPVEVSGLYKKNHKLKTNKISAISQCIEYYFKNVFDKIAKELEKEWNLPLTPVQPATFPARNSDKNVIIDQVTGGIKKRKGTNSLPTGVANYPIGRNLLVTTKKDQPKFKIDDDVDHKSKFAKIKEYMGQNAAGIHEYLIIYSPTEYDLEYVQETMLTPWIVQLEFPIEEIEKEKCICLAGNEIGSGPFHSYYCPRTRSK